MIGILIIGAGPTGLCAAKTILQYDPAADIVLVDAHATLGGVWSKEQLYPTLKTNNLFSTLDFTDFPMNSARFGIYPGQHVTGEAMHAYLTAYAEHFDLVRRVRLSTRVLDVRHRDSGAGWAVRITSGNEEGDGEILECAKLIVATGVLSVPHLPDLKGLDNFKAPFIHAVDLGPRTDELMRNPAIQTVAVLGGAKSAYDAVYLAATTGHKVEWLIRKSGRGPVWVFPPHTFLGPFKAWREKLVTRRFFSFMSPCIFPDFSGFAWLRRFLHFSSIGKSIAQAFWGAIHADTLRDCGYRTDPKLNILEPEQNPFWYGTASGTLNYEKDIFDFVRSGQVQIHRADVSHLSEHSIHLADGTTVHADALIASTGFSAKPAVCFEPTSSHADLGLPSTSLSREQKANWANLDAEADAAIGSQFPRLLRGPFQAPSSDKPKPFNPGAAAEVPYTPWRLYRGIAPPGLTAAGDHSLVFLGFFSNIANTLRLEVQCLWALGYLYGKIPQVMRDVSAGRVLQETALFQRWTQHRAPYGHGSMYPDLVFDQLPYWDHLLNDLGLATRRKRSAFRELFEPYTQDDYRGMVDEWVRKTAKGGA